MPDLRITVMSFSFRRGIPENANMVFDARFLTNPHYNAALQPMSGLDAPVGTAIETDPDFAGFFDTLTTMLGRILPRFAQREEGIFTIAIGCTGGRHRSVYVAEKLGKYLSDKKYNTDITHRDVEG